MPRLKSLLFQTDIHSKPVIDCDSYVPGMHSIFVKTWGCSHNSSDSEYMAGQLASYGFKITGKFNIFNLAKYFREI